MAFLCDISLLPEKKALFFSILQKQSSRGVLWPAALLKKTVWRRCFTVNFVTFLRTPFLTEHLWCLLLILNKKLFLVMEVSFLHILYEFHEIKLNVMKYTLNCVS